MEKIYKSTAKSEYQLTDRELSTLNHEDVPNPHYRSGRPARLYLRAEVESLAASADVQARLAAKAKRDDPAAKEARRLAREDKITKRYASWRNALLPACEAMFSLNRYAKHSTCRSDGEIYALKNSLVELLYRLGMCVECVAHERTLPEQICYACDGDGDCHEYDIDLDFCPRCGGSGIYRPAKTLRDIAFRFVVDGRTFGWHQPDHLIKFAYSATATEQGQPTEEKPAEMTTAKMREGKVIIRYVLDNAPMLTESAA